MAPRSSVILRIFLVVFVVGLSWYTIQLYANLFGIFDTPSESPIKIIESVTKDVKIDDKKVKVEDKDELIDRDMLNKVDKEWDDMEKNIPKAITLRCEMQRECKDTEFTFRIVSGAANVIGPSICFDGKWVMKNALNNVDRGMNIAVVSGKTGKMVNKGVFDLYGKDSTDLKAFLGKVKDEEIVLITTYDDAAFRLDDDARAMLKDFGSEKAKSLAFRDNWIFVGSKHLKGPTSGLEQIMVNDKAKNKFGDWPEAITVEGCIPKLT